MMKDAAKAETGCWGLGKKMPESIVARDFKVLDGRLMRTGLTESTRG